MSIRQAKVWFFTCDGGLARSRDDAGWEVCPGSVGPLFAEYQPEVPQGWSSERKHNMGMTNYSTTHFYCPYHTQRRALERGDDA